MKMKLLIFVCYVLSVSAQWADWSCNHYSSYAVDLCYQYSYSYQYLFSCNGTDQITWYQYTDNSCGTDESDPWIAITYDESSDTSDLFQCDQSQACDYAIVRIYDDEDCSNDTYSDGPVVTSQCYTGTSYSYKVSCTGVNELTVQTFTDEGNCTGSSQIVTTDYDTYSESVAGCYEVCMIYLYII